MTPVACTADEYQCASAITAQIKAYPGVSSGYIPAGTVTLADDGAINAKTINLAWKLTKIRPTLKASLMRYPGSEETVPKGTVAVEDQLDGSIKVFYDMYDFDEGAASGGLHIHTGTTAPALHAVS